MADFTDEDDALLSELGVEVASKKAASRTPREERIIAGFPKFDSSRAVLGRRSEPGAVFSMR